MVGSSEQSQDTRTIRMKWKACETTGRTNVSENFTLGYLFNKYKYSDKDRCILLPNHMYQVICFTTTYMNHLLCWVTCIKSLTFQPLVTRSIWLETDTGKLRDSWSYHSQCSWLLLQHIEIRVEDCLTFLYSSLVPRSPLIWNKKKNMLQHAIHNWTLIRHDNYRISLEKYNEHHRKTQNLVERVRAAHQY